MVQNFVLEMQKVLGHRGLRYELILVANYHDNDKRPDRTPEIAAELARTDPTIKVVARPKQGMMGWDMRSGLEAATGETIAVIDGDGQMPVQDVVLAYETLRRDGYDLVKTYRAKRFDGVDRRILSYVYNLLLRVMFPAVKVRDANSKPKLFTREALRRLALESDGWFVDAEIILRATYQGLRIGELPTVFYSNQQRASFVRPSAIIEFARELVRFRFKSLKDEGGSSSGAWSTL
jgi:glycosyltransferase involved in cell wall biosynthesis